jgi:hypothetical protein
MKLRNILVLAALLTVALPASANIYRWVDAQGRVHYSDRPVPGATRVTVATQPSDPEMVASRNAAAQQQRETADAAASAEQTDQQAARNVNRDMAKLADERCAKAKEAYRIATESQRLYRVGKDGEREYLTEAQISEARINARKALDEACPKTGG